jgi:hypothetical protein
MPVGTLDAASLRPILTRLLTLLKENDSEAVDYLETIRGELAATLNGEDFIRFQKALAVYDFEEAFHCLEGIADQLNLTV